jgi:hypothetical protein
MLAAIVTSNGISPWYVSVVIETIIALSIGASLRYVYTHVKKDIMEAIAKVHHEVVPNGGGSMADAVNRTEKQGKETALELADVRTTADRALNVSIINNSALLELQAELIKTKRSVAQVKGHLTRQDKKALIVAKEVAITALATAEDLHRTGP